MYETKGLSLGDCKVRIGEVDSTLSFPGVFFFVHAFAQQNFVERDGWHQVH